MAQSSTATTRDHRLSARLIKCGSGLQFICTPTFSILLGTPLRFLEQLQAPFTQCDQPRASHSQPPKNVATHHRPQTVPQPTTSSGPPIPSSEPHRTSARPHFPKFRVYSCFSRGAAESRSPRFERILCHFSIRYQARNSQPNVTTSHNVPIRICSLILGPSIFKNYRACTTQNTVIS
jgi:hypothetical protein